MTNYPRLLKINLPRGQSAWLWGPRKTGKSTFLRHHFQDSTIFDLLDTDLFLAFERRPALFRERIMALPASQKSKPIIVDEAQKVPLLLDEIHFLIENEKIDFLICGSSARKLKRDHANLLGGRAWRYEMYPLVYPEIPDFDLLRALQTGLLPQHYLSPDPKRSLQAYVADYLNEEVRAEGLTRNLPAFSHFLEVAGFSICEMVNYSNIARDVGVDAKTVKEYFHILVDTFIGHLVEPYRKTRRRQAISVAPKFYFFDVGVSNQLARRSINELKGSEAGKAFENYILMEIIAAISYKNLNLRVTYWRTKSGLEVDFIIGTDAPVACEVKIKDRIDKSDVKGLIAFSEEAPVKRLLVVCLEPAKRMMHEQGITIDILPWKDFLIELWSDKLFIAGSQPAQ